CLEFLRSYTSVLAWCWRNRLIDDAEMERLNTLSVDRSAEAEAAFNQAVELRETIHRLCRAVISSDSPAAADLDFLNQTLANVQPQRRLEANDQGFAWAWVQSDDLAHILAPVVLAAADLLTSDELQRVRQCPNCGWLFVDTSRNHSRRWCSMDFCGSKLKSRRQYERRKTAKI
ncbi:MAG: ABATE domain-containing protein, partial [Chloroflexota bacterium]